MNEIIQEIMKYPILQAGCGLIILSIFVVIRSNYVNKHYDHIANNTTNVCYAQRDDGKEIKIHEWSTTGKRRRELLTTGGKYYREEEESARWVIIFTLSVFVLILIKIVWF